MFMEQPYPAQGEPSALPHAIWQLGVTIMWPVSSVFALYGLAFMLYADDSPGPHPSYLALLSFFAASVGTLGAAAAFTGWGKGAGSAAQVIMRLVVCSLAFLVPMLSLS